MNVINLVSYCCYLETSNGSFTLLIRLVRTNYFLEMLTKIRKMYLSI